MRRTFLRTITRQSLQRGLMEGRTFMREKLSGCRNFWNVGRTFFGAESIHDAAFLQIVRSHLNFDLVPREDANAIDAHASCEVTEKLMARRFFRLDADPERRIGITLFNHADKLDDVFGQGSVWRKSRRMVPIMAYESKDRHLRN